MIACMKLQMITHVLLYDSHVMVTAKQIFEIT